MQQQRFLDKADGARCGSRLVHVLQSLGLVTLIATVLVSFPGCGGGYNAEDYSKDPVDYSNDRYVPRIGSLSPSLGLPGTTVNVEIKGENLDDLSEVAGYVPSLTVSGSGVTAVVTEVVPAFVDNSNLLLPVNVPSYLQATFTIEANAPLGPRTVTVRHGGGSGGGLRPGDNIFTVTATLYSGGGAGSYNGPGSR